MKRGKKYVEAAKLVDRTVQYDPAEAIDLVKKTAVAKFDETIEAHILYLQKAIKLQKQKQLVLIMLAARNSFLRSRTKDGLSLT